MGKDPNSNEQFLTLRQAAEMLNVPLYKVRNAAKRGDFPTYTLFNSRLLVLLSEIKAVMASKSEGINNA